MINYCIQCGSELMKGNKFCVKCGIKNFDMQPIKSNSIRTEPKTENLKQEQFLNENKSNDLRNVELKNKLVLPVSVLLGGIILGGFIYASQISKQNSIEKQQQIELQAKKYTEQIKTEQDERGYIAKRKTECLAIYKIESDKWRNTTEWSYIEPLKKASLTLRTLDLEKTLHGDTCKITYKSDETGESFSIYF